MCWCQLLLPIVRCRCSFPQFPSQPCYRTHQLSLTASLADQRTHCRPTPPLHHSTTPPHSDLTASFRLETVRQELVRHRLYSQLYILHPHVTSWSLPCFTSLSLALKINFTHIHLSPQSLSVVVFEYSKSVLKEEVSDWK